MNFQVEEPGGAYVLKVEPQNANKSKVKVDGELIVYNDNAAGDSGENCFRFRRPATTAAEMPRLKLPEARLSSKTTGRRLKKF